MSTSNSCTRFIWALSAAFLPVLIQAIWLSHNTQLPTSDAVGALLQSSYIAHYAIDHDWAAFFSALFTMRDWRPIALYLVEVPFQVISGGNLMFTVAAMTLLCTLTSCLYIYRLLCLVLEQRVAALGTALLGLLPLVQWPATFLGYAEAVLMPAVLATAYHLIRSRELHDARHSVYCVLVTVAAFALRPAEAALFLIPLYTTFLSVAWHRRSITGAQVYFTITLVMVSASVLVLSGWWPHGFAFPRSEIFNDEARGKWFVKTGSTILIATGLLLGYGIRQYIYNHLTLRQIFPEYFSPRLRGEIEGNYGSILCPPYIIHVSVGVCVLVVSYYWGYVPQLVEWLYITTWGNLASPGNSILETLWHFILSAGLLPFTGITLLGIISYIFCLTREQRQWLLHQPLLYLTMLVPFALLVVLTSAQHSQRKITIALCAHLLLMMIPALMQGRWQGARITLLTAIAVWQLTGVAWISTGRPHTAWLEYTIGSHDAFPPMVTARPNPHEVVADFVVAYAKRNGLRQIALPLVRNGFTVIDPFLLRALILLRNKSIEPILSEPLSYDAHTTPDFLRASHTPFLLIIDSSTVEKLSTLRDQAWLPIDKIAYDLLILQSTGRLEALGAHKRDCVMFPVFHAQACLFDLGLKTP